MVDIQSVRINTAGAYVLIEGYYLFAIGIQWHNGQYPVVRLGGHRETCETGWECAAREVYEEASLHIEPLLPQTTYLSDWNHIEADLQEIQWQTSIEQEPTPSLVVTYQSENRMHLSLMYLAHAEGFPKPSCEVKGLLLLTQEEIHHLCQAPLTLAQYLNRGGRAILNADFDAGRVLEPFVQLRLLSKMLSLRSENKVTSTW